MSSSFQLEPFADLFWLSVLHLLAGLRRRGVNISEVLSFLKLYNTKLYEQTQIRLFLKNKKIIN